MKRLWSSWVELLSREETGQCLAAMRILAAVTVLHMVGQVLLHGLFTPLYGGHINYGARSWLVEALGGPTPELAWTLLATTTVAAIALGLGVGARVAALVAGQCLLALRGINSAQGAYAAMTSNVLWLCVLSRCDTTWSLSCRLRTGRWTSDELVPAWPRFMAVFQLVVIYVWTGLSKISVAWIGDFSALYYVLQTPTWQRFDMRWAAWVYPLTQLMTGLIWLWEVSFGVVLLAAYYRETADRPGRVRAWFNRHDLRVPYLVFGAGAHLTIASLMVVGPFLFATLSFYPCMFPPATWRAALERLRGSSAR